MGEFLVHDGANLVVVFFGTNLAVVHRLNGCVVVVLVNLSIDGFLDCEWLIERLADFCAHSDIHS